MTTKITSCSKILWLHLSNPIGHLWQWNLHPAIINISAASQMGPCCQEYLSIPSKPKMIQCDAVEVYFLHTISWDWDPQPYPPHGHNYHWVLEFQSLALWALLQVRVLRATGVRLEVYSKSRWNSSIDWPLTPPSRSRHCSSKYNI